MPTTSSTPPDYLSGANGITPPVSVSVTISGSPVSDAWNPNYEPIDPATGDPAVNPWGYIPTGSDSSIFPTNTGWGSSASPADGSTWSYSDTNGTTSPVQGQTVIKPSTGAARYPITLGSGASYGIGVYATAIDPATETQAIYAVIAWQYSISTSSYVSFGAVSAPLDTKAYRAAVRIGASGSGTMSVAGNWPATGTATDFSGVTSPCPAGAFALVS